MAEPSGELTAEALLKQAHDELDKVRRVHLLQLAEIPPLLLVQFRKAQEAELQRLQAELLSSIIDKLNFATYEDQNGAAANGAST